MNNFYKYGFFLLLGVISLFVITHNYMRSRGYHLQWSSANVRWVYVDKDGKP